MSYHDEDLQERHERIAMKKYQAGLKELSGGCDNPNCKITKTRHTAAQVLFCKKFAKDPTRFSVEPDKMKKQMERYDKSK